MFRNGKIALVLALAMTSGCAYYSFTGASIPPRLDTIAIPFTIDETTTPLTGLDDELNEQLIRRFVQQTRLSLETDETDADAILSTRITLYRNDPISVGGQERATLNRISMSVHARYHDNVLDSLLLEQTFIGSEEYDPVRDGRQGEAQAANAALDEIAQDIFNAMTSDW